MAVRGVEDTSKKLVLMISREGERDLDLRDEATNRISQKVLTDHGHEIDRRDDKSD